jgi:hypothetical protein
MHTIGGRCPVCGEEMFVERMRCAQCGTAIEGAFALSPLFSLSAEQLHFVEMLVKHEGNIQKVAEEMQLSYRTARSRMDEIATALGYSLPKPARPRPTPERRRAILEGLHAGQIKTEQAVRLLQGDEE